MQVLVTGQNLFVQFGVDDDTILFNQIFTALVVAFRFDALYFGQQLSEERAQFLVVVHYHVGLAVAFGKLDYLVGFAVLIGPAGDELTVAHVRLFDILARLDAGELSHQTVHHVLIVSSFVSIGRGEQTQFQNFGIGHVVEGEEVGASLLERRAVSLQSIGVYTGEQLARAVTQTLVQVGVQVVGLEQVFVDEVALGVAPNELVVESVTLGSLLVSLGNVFDGYRLGAVQVANPVGVGQVDTDRGRGVAVAGQHGSGDDLGRYTLYLLFLEAGIYRRVVFEPLGVFADGVGAFRGFEVLEVDNRLPAGFHAQRVAVGLGKAVYEVDLRIEVFYPQDSVLVKVFQVACLVIFDEFLDDLFLLVVLGYAGCFLQPEYNLFDSFGVEAAYFVGLFHNLAVAFYQTAVQSVRDGSLVFGVLHVAVEGLGFGLGYPVVIVAGRGGDEVFAGSLVHPFRHDRRVEDNGHQRIEEVVDRSTFGERQFLRVERFHGIDKELLRETGHEFIASVVVVDTVGEPYPFQVYFEVLEVFALAVAGIVLIDCFEGTADSQVPFSVLVIENVPTVGGSLGEVVDQLFLLKCQLFESRYFVAQDFQIGKRLYGVVEVVFLFLGSTRGQD